ncbi:enoyl-CoA hydratase/isomerase family protein [Sphingosinicella microcystinivorans]|uniref:Crotonase n=1 Tax=Sphingosinicella microcystinivorans TaxID=335406 RepID=A0AAD1G005_SPHMI|nr:enoyl-CoA hydratase-related protein [Sphingosinicella microcystinivorans]RKS84955.1 enoyl-CoA hydratase/carnithine racemase [Sphingosinicella microcystinivorans]BBE33387.1 crotonase [Sphingosinicella microcystinivorans]
MFETIDYHVENGIALFRLNRPDRSNAIDQRMNMELPLAWERFRTDPSAIVAIVTGSGNKAFCTGADLHDLPALDDRATAADAIRWTSLQNRVWKPVICAVNGLTVGGGLHFIADSDIVLSSRHAEFCDSHVSVGLVSGLEPISLARRIPMEAVLRLALVGRDQRMTAEHALRLGMIGEVVEADALMPRAFAIAHSITKNSPSAMARTKRAIWRSLELPLHDALERAWEDIARHNRGADFAEGCAAFAERRSPIWQPWNGEDADA